MNRLVNKILKETKEDDPFFQAKNIESRIQKRNEELKEEQSKLMRKVKIGLKKMRYNYENEIVSEQKEQMFLQYFLNLHPHKNISSTHIFLKNDKNVTLCYFDLINEKFHIDYYGIWTMIKFTFDLTYFQTREFMNDMLIKYFKTNAFIPVYGM